MQFTLDMDAGARTKRLLVIDYLLRKSINLPRVTYRLEPVTQLVKAVLGARTTGEVSVQALSDLRAHYPDWNQLSEASPEEMLAIIKPVTHAQGKAENLIKTFRLIRDERGSVDLSHLETLSVPLAILWLERLPGVGRKVSASVLNASTLYRRALVIDTHHLRILQRLGLISHKHDYHAAYDRIMPQIPESWCATRIDDHHRRFKRLGQTVCGHNVMSCNRCPQRPVCQTANQKETGWGG